ncbi:STAS domain-containing protein [Calidifontibacillus oryziterrae]|uniref:STAS domain-containing protein n=1 Tax=Calidifontibacillus oryziterrae TaxID=1191699 RepID=UPI0002E97DEF|nr:STAS domain-containing protein [Calidifontibacillus oryziterrae]
MRKIQWSQDVSLNNLNEFKDKINELLASPSRQLILDLKGTKYANSRAFGIIAYAIVEAKKKDREIVIIRVEKTMQKLFDILRFQTIVTFLKDEKEAFDYFFKYEDMSVLTETIN